MTLTGDMTNVAAGRIILAGGQERRLYTSTSTGAGETHTFLEFEAIYFVRAWKQSDGVDAEAFVTAADYTTGVTVTQNPGAVYIEVIGTSIRSTGGAT